MTNDINIAEIIREKWPQRHTDDGTTAIGRIADFCRFRFKMDYSETKSFVEKALGESIDPAEWDAVLYRYGQLVG